MIHTYDYKSRVRATQLSGNGSRSAAKIEGETNVGPFEE
jgi:hypothetical protein